MKRLIVLEMAVLSVLLISMLVVLSILLLTSCTERYCARDIANEFLLEYPLDAKVYFSDADEETDGYIDEETLTLIFDCNELPNIEYALILYGKVSTVREIGVFIIENGDDMMDISRVISDRIELLSSLCEGEGFVRKYKTVLVYGFVDDRERAERLFDKIIK